MILLTASDTTTSLTIMAINASKPKRKLTTSASVPRKRAKTYRLSTNDLPWKTVSRPQEAGLGDAFDGVLELEEVDDIEVVYEETDVGRVIKFNVRFCASVKTIVQ